MIYRQVEQMSTRAKITWIAIYLLICALVVLAGLFCMRAFISSYYYCEIRGLSMQPTINPGTVIQREKQDGAIVKVTNDVKYNDIVIIEEDPSQDNNWEGENIVKRVIAMDGDAITIIFDDFTQNADNSYHTFVVRAGSDTVERLDESYIDKDIMDDWVHGRSFSNRVPRKDTTSHQTQFQYEGLIYSNYLAKYCDGDLENTKILVKNIDYINEEGEQVSQPALFYQLGDDEIFYMGDNRAKSSDARDTANRTTVKREKVVGKVVWIIKDAIKKDQAGMLWWAKIEGFFGYFWNETVNYFAW